MPVPIVSVVTPIYNSDEFLVESIESILCQTRADFELILIDDGSTDRSLEIIQQYASLDRRVKVISRPNTGIVGALNDGIAVARGEFIAIMHADDISFPERLDRQVDYLNAYQNCVAVGTAILRVDSDGGPLHTEPWTCDSANIRIELLLGRGGLAHPTAMIRAECLRSIGGYREQFELVEDKDLWLRLDEIGELGNLPEVLVAYRRHAKTLSNLQVNKVRRSLVKCVEDAYRRRMLPEPVPLRLKPLSHLSPQRELARWVRGAAANGSIDTASYYMKRLILEHPADIRTWRTTAQFIGSITNHFAKRLFSSTSEMAKVELLNNAIQQYRLTQKIISRNSVARAVSQSPGLRQIA